MPRNLLFRPATGKDPLAAVVIPDHAASPALHQLLAVPRPFANHTKELAEQVSRVRELIRGRPGMTRGGAQRMLAADIAVPEPTGSPGLDACSH